MAAAIHPPLGTLNKLKTLTCLAGKQGTDPLLDEIQREVESTSVLDAMKSYISALHGKLDNNARPFKQLAALFAAGITPARVEGHHDGVALGIRTGDEPGLLASYGNFMGMFWSTAIGPVSPWVGKSFGTTDPETIRRYSGGFEHGETPTYIGINHFNRLEESVMNRLSLSALTFWMGLKEVTPEEKELYGHDRDGGLFLARKAHSVYSGTDREVFTLNYRWSNLSNLPPFRYLIDELVEIADGVYLGQLLLATQHLLSHYDPSRPPDEYHYQHFGYFLLMDDSWAAETRRVFPHIEPGRITSTPRPSGPIAVPSAGRAVSPSTSKYTTLTLADPLDGNCNDVLFQEIRAELSHYPTILDLLKFYSTELMEHYDNSSPYFLKLRELFNRGQGPEQVRGYLRGALVSFHAEGFYKLFDLNTLDVAWKVGRLFTPWTGKTFEDIAADRLAELTDGFEKGTVPTFWGSNTVSLRTVKQKFVGKLMNLAGMWSEPVPKEESLKYGYDRKSFFFIAHQARSINDENRGKKVFQFNYRWPGLRTFPPDNYCIDELVMLADGLYLGQLIYSTEMFAKYDPARDPSAYTYRVFGYFLLMDKDWQKRRLEIGFDPYDV